MILTDYLVKWITTKKNLYGLIGFTLIMILLGMNFSYWAGAITLGGGDNQGNITDDVETEEPWMYELAVDDSHSGSLLAPSLGNIRIEGITFVRHDFQVPENSTLGFVNVTVSGTKARPDFDMVVYGPDGEAVVESKTEAAEEHIELDYKDFNRTGPGTWSVEVDNYSSFNINYELTIQIHIKAPLEDSEKKEGD